MIDQDRLSYCKKMQSIDMSHPHYDFMRAKKDLDYYYARQTLGTDAYSLDKILSWYEKKQFADDLHLCQ